MATLQPVSIMGPMDIYKVDLWDENYERSFFYHD